MGQGMFHAADGYDRLIGRFLPSLAPAFADFAEVRAGSVLDVGCGPGGLTAELARRVGAGNVSAIDPSPPFVVACRERVPGVQVVEGVAEGLPFPDGSFDAALSSLVVGFMSDAQQGVREMVRVTRPGGTVALCFWDHSRMQSIARFWRAAHRAIGAEPAGDRLLGTQQGDLAQLLEGAALRDIRVTELVATGGYRDVDDLWSGYTAGIGPIGQYMQGLDQDEIEAVRGAVREDLDTPDRPFTLSAVAWAARATT
ncbi:class I SAM-dependent methyltransferase [Microbacterium sp.]|uniref:class I SAM-dependent methyltransferase n=1 Tax=Microbacterium sp. TaxID=51671 RepID=UPI0028121517|nr:class I SAM-dependent methyltransferase [Microbacterium sp.]